MTEPCDSPRSPLLSIITITLNDPSGLSDTLRSIASQILGAKNDFEQIIVDGMSSYDVAALVQGIGSDAKLHRDRDAGIYDAMNRGTKLASGAYLIYLNGGDQFANPHVLASLIEVLTNETADFIYGDSLERQTNGDLELKIASSCESARYGMFTHHQSMVFRRKIIENHGINFDTQYTIAADYDFVLHYLRHADQIVKLGGPIATFAAGGASQVKCRQGRIEQFKIRHAHFDSRAFAYRMLVIQTLSRSIRIFLPKLYWELRRVWVRLRSMIGS